VPGRGARLIAAWQTGDGGGGEILTSMDFVTVQSGWIEVICGPMFSGKSEELMRRLRRAARPAGGPETGDQR